MADHASILTAHEIQRLRLRNLPELYHGKIVRALARFVSTPSAWESAIKISLGRLELPDRFETGVIDSGFEKLLITFTHAEAVAALPYHHPDPFDRLLIAQAASMSDRWWVSILLADVNRPGLHAWKNLI